MDSDAFDRLTTRQKECLRLVAAPANSKQIARELGISSHTVDEHIRAALATLAIPDRMAAARALMAHEGGRPPQVSPVPDQPVQEPAQERDARDAPPQTLSSQSAGMAADPAAGASSPQIGTPGAATRFEGEATPAVPEDSTPRPLWPSPPFPTPGKPRNVLDRTTRLLWIALVLAGLILAASLYIALAVRYSGTH